MSTERQGAKATKRSQCSERRSERVEGSARRTTVDSHRLRHDRVAQSVLHALLLVDRVARVPAQRRKVLCVRDTRCVRRSTSANTSGRTCAGGGMTQAASSDTSTAAAHEARHNAQPSSHEGAHRQRQRGVEVGRDRVNSDPRLELAALRGAEQRTQLHPVRRQHGACEGTITKRSDHVSLYAEWREMSTTTKGRVRKQTACRAHERTARRTQSREPSLRYR